MATRAVRAPRSSSSALVPTVIPWANASTSAAAPAPARRAPPRPRRSRPATGRRAWSGPWPCAARGRRSRTASVNVPPTSTPEQHRRATYRAPSHRSSAPRPSQQAGVTCSRSARQRPSRGAPPRSSSGAQPLEGLLEVLVRRAVVAARQRLALARRSLARVRPALARAAVEPELLGQLLEELDARARRCARSRVQTQSWSGIAKWSAPR